MKLQVGETRYIKMFKLDGATHSVINKMSVYTHGYWDYFIPLAYAYRKPRVLMIGLGMGTTSYQLHRLLGSSVRVDAVEIDRKVAEIARRNAPEAMPDRLVIADGYAYAKKARKRYDIIVLDAYWRNAAVPGRFFSESFTRNAHSALRAKGVLAINYTMGPQGMLHWPFYKRLLKKYFTVYSVSTDHSDVIVLLCSRGMGRDEMVERISSRMRASGYARLLLGRYKRMKQL